MCKVYKNKPIIIGEIAFNHEGDFNYLRQAVEELAKTNVTHVKFQVLINADEFVSEKSASYDTVKNWCFSEKEWNEIFSLSSKLGLRIFGMPLDTKAVEILDHDYVDYIEIHSVSFYDYDLISLVKKIHLDKVVAFGVGGRTLEELVAINDYFEGRKLLFMVGFQAYPSELEDIKLTRIKSIKSKFPNHLIGYADHSAPESPDSIYASHYACCLGVNIFEKHFSLQQNRTDSDSAFNTEKMINYVESIHRLMRILEVDFSQSFIFSSAEVVYRDRQKKAVAIKDINKDEEFDSKNIALKMHSEKGNHNNLESLIGKKSPRIFKKGDVICTEKK
ncbi:putative N-acetylneuraminate synthase [Vibrio harveyi]|uniref:N-acetylneuraminate synthase family protein n=1 Tax=Vibrio harveyi TaxID=669 RepID=UPI002AD8EC30|nr:N-acetylneuraminate synthase family protein [Vibrio harveyi]CAK6712082.1 putative N-acetylneuraminate synthase [Vibrio harveyi]